MIACTLKALGSSAVLSLRKALSNRLCMLCQIVRLLSALAIRWKPLTLVISSKPEEQRHCSSGLPKLNEGETVSFVKTPASPALLKALGLVLL